MFTTFYGMLVLDTGVIINVDLLQRSSVLMHLLADENVLTILTCTDSVLPKILMIPVENLVSIPSTCISVPSIVLIY